MWLIKLPFRIIALPFMLVIGIISVFYHLLLQAGTFAVGLVYIVLGLCLTVSLLQRAWLNMLILLLAAAFVFLAAMFAEGVSLGLKTLTEKLTGFIFS